MALTTSGIRARFNIELLARGMDPTSIGGAPWSGAFLDALATFATVWSSGLTAPGNGPIIPPPPTQPHVHLPVPGLINAVTLRAAAQPSLLTAGFVSGFGWDFLLGAWCTAVSTHVTIALTEVQDGNLPHTHTKWSNLSATVLAGLIKSSFLGSYPGEFEITNPDSQFSAYVDAVSEGLVDSIQADAETGPALYLFGAGVHAHALL